MVLPKNWQTFVEASMLKAIHSSMALQAAKQSDLLLSVAVVVTELSLAVKIPVCWQINCGGGGSTVVIVQFCLMMSSEVDT